MREQDWRTWHCPRCGHTAIATHARPKRRCLWLLQTAEAHTCPWWIR